MSEDFQMFFRRRGCLLGCSVLFALCVAIGLLAWFVGIPKFAEAIEDGLGENLSTEIAREIEPLYTRADLQSGQDVTFSFDSINQSLEDNNSDNPGDSIKVVNIGDRIVLSADFQGQVVEFEFIPRVDNQGRLELEPVGDDGWWSTQIMNVLSGGFEGGINEWLDVNGLVLTNVELVDGGIVLSVEGE